MSRQPPDDMHQRFAEWLAQGAHGDPPRDTAVHAFVCPACRREMAAFDALSAIDPSRATLPASRPVAVSGTRSFPWWRGAAATAVLVMVAVVSFGAFRMLALPVASDATETPVQAVLGGEGSPGPRIGAIGGEANGLVPSPTPVPSMSDAATPTPLATAQANPPASTRRPIGTQQPLPTTPATHTVAATPTQRPTPAASASASASASARPPSSTPVPTATLTPVPTPTPTVTPPTPTPEPTPTPRPAASVGELE